MAREIRRPTVEDAAAMGALHVRAWHAAYRSVMPDDYLDALRPEERASMWQRQIESPTGPGLLVVVVKGFVAGFAAFGPCVDEDVPEGWGQLGAINLDPDYWGGGHGRALLRAATAELAGHGFDELVLWVVPENSRARRLYESEGWTADGTSREEDVLGVVVTEMRYRRSV